MKAKKIFSVILALFIAIATLSSCNTEVLPPEDAGQTTAPQKTEQPHQTNAPYIAPADDAYLDIECSSTDSYKEEQFAFNESKHAIIVNLPEEWELVSGESFYTVTKDGKNIGKLFSGSATDTASWKSVDSKTSTQNGVDVTMNIEKNLVKNNPSFRHRFTFSYNKLKETNTLTLIFNYGELDSAGCDNILNTPHTVRIASADYMGDLSHILPDSGDAEILILGNSFIASSGIGTHLNQMFELNNKPITVNAISWGFATVDTYIKDPGIMSEIRSGKYQAVFICGFYYTYEISNSFPLKEACDVSGTELVIFPAHNETSFFAEEAGRRNDVLCLNWLRELDMLIDRGVPRYELCADDMFGHSTLLAGYVGAQMIYRAIFNELPEKFLQQARVNSLLGDHSTVPFKSAPINQDIHYLP